MASYEDIKTSSIDVFLLLNDIVEKTNKFQSDDIDRFAVSAVTGKRVPPLVKKMYDLEEAIGRFRSDVRRAVMLNAKSSTETAAASDDPIDTSVTAKPELPTIAPVDADVKSAPTTDSSTDSAGGTVTAAATVAEKTKKATKKPEKAEKAEKPKAAAKVEEKPATGEVIAIPAAAPPAAIVEEQKPVAAPVPVHDPSPTNNVSDAALPKKGGRPKKAVAEAVAAEAPVAPAPAPVAAVETVVVEAEDDSKAPLSTRRKKIPKAVRVLCWNLHIGSHKGEDRCMCCKEKKIDVASFHCGHVLAESKGGDLTIKNLRPICASCNSAMGTRSMNEFTKEFFGWEI